MQKRFLNLVLFISISLFIISCANRGAPDGGEKDEEPPIIVKETPKNFSTNFKGDEIRIYFNEYIKIKELSKQLIISPPMATIPNITPTGAASKYINIKIFDTLKPNTTYAINFGNSIVDNNEENPFTYFRYVFSTGNTIDSLVVKGRIKDALEMVPDTFISVMLYEVNEKYTDSVVYKENPKYITNTLDSTTNFSIENVRAGKYLLVAMKDENKDNKFQQEIDKIGFYSEFIEVPTSKNYDLSLFSEAIDYNAKKPRLIAGEKIAFGFSGDYKAMAINPLSNMPNDFDSRVMKDPKADSLYYFYKPKLKVDSLIFTVTNKKIIDTFTVRIKDNKKDSLLIDTRPIGTIGYNQDFIISGNIPFKSFNERKITILDQDSLKIDFTSRYDTLSNSYNLTFKKTEANDYNIQLLPETVTDFFGNKNDTLNFNVRTDKENSYGKLRVQLENAIYPVIVQLTNEKGIVKYEQYATGDNNDVDFVNLKPNKFNLRVIYDTNKNGVYDSGSFLKRIKPERVIYSNKPIEIRAGWEEITPFILK